MKQDDRFGHPRRLTAGAVCRMTIAAMLSTTDLKNLLVQAFPGALVEVSDLTGTSDHFQAVIVAPQFRGKSRIEQHQIVFGALGDRMSQEIHALSLSTRAAEMTQE